MESPCPPLPGASRCVLTTTTLQQPPAPSASSRDYRSTATKQRREPRRGQAPAAAPPQPALPIPAGGLHLRASVGTPRCARRSRFCLRRTRACLEPSSRASRRCAGAPAALCSSSHTCLSLCRAPAFARRACPPSFPFCLHPMFASSVRAPLPLASGSAGGVHRLIAQHGLAPHLAPYGAARVAPAADLAVTGAEGADRRF